MWTPVYYVRQVSLPITIEGVSVPNDDGSFDIYINSELCELKQTECLEHEIRHIIEDHFYQERKSVAQLEQEADGKPAAPAALTAPPVPPAPPQPTLLPDVFKEAPTGSIPYFASLEAFRDYMYSMRDQVQREIRAQKSNAG